ncbi:MAG: putative zinc-binding protein, partial [Candidatus Helarchaeales archaeon]
MGEIKKYDKITFIPCSGAEYNGELARKVAIELSEKSPIADFSSVFCMTIFLKYNLLKEERMAEMMKNGLTSGFIVIIDGCSGACAFKIFKHLNIKPNLVVNLRKLIPKKHVDLSNIKAILKQNLMTEIREVDVQKVKNHVLEQ